MTLSARDAADLAWRRGYMAHGQAIAVGRNVARCGAELSRIAEAAGKLGVPVARLGVQDVRRALRCRDDAGVKAAIRAHVDGWPARSNSHHRDAAAVALVAGWQAGRKVG